jgi:hypothetical protein
MSEQGEDFAMRKLLGGRQAFLRGLCLRRPKLLFLVGLTLGALVAPTARADAPSEFAAGGGQGVFVSGGTTTSIQFAFAAETNEPGELGAGRGYIVVEDPTAGLTRVRGHVDCVDVDANTATFSGIVDEGPSSDIGARFFMFVQDLGEPENGSSPDTVSFGITSEPFFRPCLGPVSRGSAFQGRGNVVVGGS